MVVLRPVFAMLAAALSLAVFATPALAQDWDDGGWDDAAEQQEAGDWGVPADDTDPQAPAVEIPATPWEPPVAQPQQPAQPQLPQLLPVPKGKTIKGKVARVRADGTAAIPLGAPKSVRTAIRAANKLIGKPYKWGGGHGSLRDSGYDCSGSVGFSLVHAGLMGGVMVSGQMARWANGGHGKWITVFANNGHVYMEIAGLRFDTSPIADPAGKHGPRWRPLIGQRSGFHARHPAGL
jgi:cell wall-associated NlpC family hydrolase